MIVTLPDNMTTVEAKQMMMNAFNEVLLISVVIIMIGSVMSYLFINYLSPKI